MTGNNVTALPSAVQRKAEEANRLIAEGALQSQSAPQPPPGAAPSVVGEASTVDAAPGTTHGQPLPVASPQPEDLLSTVPPQQPSQSLVANPQGLAADNMAAPAQPAAGSEPPQDDLQRTKAAYEALRGKYQSEVPRLATENAQLQQQVASLQEQVRDLSAAQPATPNGPDQAWATAYRSTKAYKDAVELDGEQAAEEQLRQVHAAVQTPEQATPQRGPAPQPTADQSQPQQQQSQLEQSQINAFLSSLDLLAGPGYYEPLVNNGHFNAWLNQTDPVTGQNRRLMMHQAIAQGNYPGAVEIWKNGAVAINFDPLNVSPSDPREQLVEPAQSQGATVVQQAPPILSAQAYQAHATRMGKDAAYRNSEEGQQRSRMFNQALSEGRLQ